ncbi:c-type cytochrome biogenesis protein CcmI [Roseobacter ponti]|uniref:C-type cytochrome biogenesis protein CcmI n=1 Tax=Roseobacter ponti TaxID=1891787 RepID=A0A858SRV4_9RHOB|nr:c-type cytochrome biogenesis protein CcmI [Roseobacter ponti]QJF50638.1 c-type cytochrome biogenesis protein CcmI [Roseobacter ponti]
MIFWIIAGGLATVVAVLIALAMRAPRKRGTEPAAAYDLRVYRDQLREVDRDLARGVVSQADAERVRAEVSRRILAADAALQKEQAGDHDKKGAPQIVAAVAAVLLIGGSVAIYTQLGAPGYGDLALADRIAMADERRASRPAQEAAEASLPRPQTPASASPDYIALVEQLRTTVANRPGDVQGQILLAQNEANLNNFPAAADAQREVIRLKGDAAEATDYAGLADMLVLSAGGYVSPEAEAALQTALSLDPGNGTARYYMGLMMSQVGRPDTAFRIWDGLLREGPEDAPWIPPVLAQIEEMAFRAGVNYQLPEIGGGRGPTAADIEAAGDMTPAERMEMIGNMVSGLSDRLATEGGPVEDWAQLITALGVLGQTSQAAAVYENATEVFAGDTRALDLLLRAGQRAQVAE